MKKIISVGLVILMIVSMLAVSVSVSAADKPKVTYKVNWSELNYEGCTFETKYDVETYFNITKTENLLSFSNIGTGKIRAYVATERFEISADTKYEYVFQAKNNYAGGYSGAVFAYAENYPYFVYGSFNNNSDVSGKCFIDVRRGTHQDTNTTTDTGFNKAYVNIDNDSEKYGTFKVVYDGYKVTVYALYNSTYQQIGNTITLPSNAYVAMGGYNRDGSEGTLERTVSVRNAVVYAMNSAAAENMSAVADVVFDLGAYIEQIENDYPAKNYVPESYADLADALEAAKSLLEEDDYDEFDVEAVIEAIEDAIFLLEELPADFSALEALIAKAEALNEEECNAVAYGMLMSAVEKGKALLEEEDVKQADIDEQVADILEKYKQVVPDATLDDVITPDGDASNDDASDDGSDEGAENNGEENNGTENNGTENNGTDGAVTDQPAGDGQITDINPNAGATDVVAAKGGCGSVILSSSICGIVALAGVAALVLKKKED